MGEYVHRQIFLTFLLLFLNLFKLHIGILLGSRSRLHAWRDLRLCSSRLTLDCSIDERFTHKFSLIKRYLIRFTDRPVRKRSTSFSVGLPRAMWAYFLWVLSVLYTVSVLILRRESFTSSAITLSCVLISQNVAHASTQKVAHAWRGLNCDLRPNEKKTKLKFQLGRFPWKAGVNRS